MSPFQVVVVSHDAAFLDAVATDVLLLAHGPRQLEAFRGRYSAFKAQRPEIHAYLTRRTDLRGNSTLAGGDKFSLTFPRFGVGRCNEMSSWVPSAFFSF